VNVKRVYRLIKKYGLLLERHTGRRRPRKHDGQVPTIRSNLPLVRWCSDFLEFTCWSGEVVRIAFALDCEVIGWVATTAGISGEMIRDMMVQYIEKRFDAIRAPRPYGGCPTTARSLPPTDRSRSLWRSSWRLGAVFHASWKSPKHRYGCKGRGGGAMDPRFRVWSRRLAR
jgi:hypothetical protein